jgi:hypothetical protein
MVEDRLHGVQLREEAAIDRDPADVVEGRGQSNRPGDATLRAPEREDPHAAFEQALDDPCADEAARARHDRRADVHIIARRRLLRLVATSHHDSPPSRSRR